MLQSKLDTINVEQIKDHNRIYHEISNADLNKKSNNEQIRQHKQLNTDNTILVVADDDFDTTSEVISNVDGTEWQRVSYDRKNKSFNRNEYNENKNSRSSFHEESDIEFTNRMESYYNKRRDNYVKNDTDLRDLYVEDGDHVYKYFCAQCSYEATSANLLKKHILNTHEDK